MLLEHGRYGQLRSPKCVCTLSRCRIRVPLMKPNVLLALTILGDIRAEVTRIRKALTDDDGEEEAEEDA